MSPALEEKLPYRNLVVSDDASIVIMVNEEDHLRIQSMASGLQLQQAYDHAVQIDKAIEAKHPYAFDERFGYLTACPTNVGTGLRASVMLHLPALTMSGRITRLIRSIIQLGVDLDILPPWGNDTFNELVAITRPNFLTKYLGDEDLTEADRDSYRAKVIRQKLSK